MRIKCLLVMAGMLWASLSQANLLINGSFESPDQPAGTWNIYPALPGWSAGSSGVELRDNNAGVAADGSQFVELDTTSNSWIEQSVATVAGQNYWLSFFYSPRIGVSSLSNVIDVLIEGSAAGTYTGNGGNAHNWQLFHIGFTATDAMTTLRFQAGGTSDSLGGSLDGVSLVVPAPGTLLLVACALPLLPLRRRMQA